MARAKKARNTDSAAFTEAVEASTALDGTGVQHDGAGPVVTEKLSADERHEAGQHLADKLVQLAEVEQDYKDTSAKFRKDIKARKKAIVELRDEVASGMRQVPAQRGLPGVDVEPREMDA
jgi:hypothetical protein